MPDLEYYDKLLVGMIAVLTGGAVVGLLTPVAAHVGVFFGAVAATPFLYAALFRNPPLPETEPAVKAAAVVWHVILVGYALVLWF